MPNPFLLYIKTVLFQEIQFSFSTKFSLVWSIDWTYQVLPLRIRVDLEAMAMKEYSIFLKAPAILEPHYQIVLCDI